MEEYQGQVQCYQSTPTQEAINEMKSLMLNDLDDTPVGNQPTNYQQPMQPMQTMQHPVYDVFENFDPLAGYAVGASTPMPTYQTPDAVVSSRLAPNSKSIYQYDISMGGKQVVTGVWMAECAQAIANLLNEGCAINDERLFTIISSCVVYDKMFTELKQKYSERAKVLRECKYDKAQEIDAVVATLKEKAESMRGKTIAYMNKHGISYK